MADFRRNNRFKGNGGAFKGPRSNRNNDHRENGGRRELGRQQGGECFTLRIEKMVQGGEGMARMEDGRVCFVAGALPDELCKVRLTFQMMQYILHHSGAKLIASGTDSIQVVTWMTFTRKHLQCSIME